MAEEGEYIDLDEPVDFSKDREEFDLLKEKMLDSKPKETGSSINTAIVTTLLICFVGFFIIKDQFIIEGTFGMMDVLISAFQWGIIFVLILIPTANWAQKAVRPKYNFLPIITTGIILFISLLGKFMQDSKLNSPDKLTAITKMNHKMDTLKLKEDGKYYAEVRAIEWFSRYSGDYKINNDSIYLDNEIISKTDSEYFDLYIFNHNKEYLIPIIGDTTTTDSLKWLKVIFNKQ